MDKEVVKIFIGSGEASLLERKVLIYSLRKHTKRDLDLYVFNGTHNAIERNNEPPVLAPMSLRVKYHNATEFSLYRFIIPEVCKHQGRAIFLDSDMVCFDDIGKLYDTPTDNFDFLARPGALGDSKNETWGLSAMLINCATCRFDLEEIFDEIDAGLYTYQDLARMSQVFQRYHPYKIGELDKRWNMFDQYDADTGIIHYTQLYTQPWKYRNHPYGEIWFQYFNEARNAGYVTDEDIHKTLIRAYARLDLLEGNSGPAPQHGRKRKMRRILKKKLRKLQEKILPQ